VPASTGVKASKRFLWSDMCLVAPESAKNAKALSGFEELDERKA
jgi:hypothetical protein